ncbi:hypothetical protein GCK32_013313, partial [Trichostrongylus colubriformis]
ICRPAEWPITREVKVRLILCSSSARHGIQFPSSLHSTLALRYCAHRVFVSISRKSDHYVMSGKFDFLEEIQSRTHQLCFQNRLRHPLTRRMWQCEHCNLLLMKLMPARRFHSGPFCFCPPTQHHS